MRMPAPQSLRVTVDESPPEHDARVVLDGLLAFNVAVLGDPGYRPLGCFVRDADGRALGGLLGHVRWRWLYVAKLWVPDALRGRGLGSRLLAAAEAFAWRHDCLGAYLDTFEYQALQFYEKQGYELFGTLDGYPPGYRQFFVRKLRPGEGAPA
jgi:GNAT superfamily N-acetyltransferase